MLTFFKKVFPFESENVDVEMLPCVMLGKVTWQKAWVAAPFEIEIRYEVEMTGYLVFDDNELNAKAMLNFTTEFSLMFEDRDAEEIEIPGRTYRIHYHSEPPLDAGELDYSFVGGAFCRSFHCTWHGWITRPTWHRGIEAPGGVAG